MISVKIASIVAIAAFAAGSFFAAPVQQAIAAVIATDVQCTGCVGTADLAGSAVTAAKIKDGEVRIAEIAGNAVTSAKIADGTIISGDIKDKGINAVDMNPAFISGGFKVDGQDGWNPAGDTEQTGRIFTITNIPNAFDSSVVAITVNDSTWFAACSVIDVFTGGFKIACEGDPTNGAFLDYVVINRPQ